MTGLVSGETGLIPVVPSPAITLLVTNTDDSGPGSLRQAILDANAALEAVSISFQIPGTDPNFSDVDSQLPGGDAEADVFVIRPATALPALMNSYGGIQLDGLTQAIFGGETNPWGPEIVLDGSLADAVVAGLLVESSHNVIRDLVIQSFDGDGIRIGDGYFTSDMNTVAGNYLGVDATGTQAAGNSHAGVQVSGNYNLIGGLGTNDRNLISANGHSGIVIRDLGLGADFNQVVDNYVGTDLTGEHSLGNGAAGLTIESGQNNQIGDLQTDRGNLFSGNHGPGILLDESAQNNLVVANLIGTTAAGNAALGNGASGVEIGGTNNQVGSPLARNVISANAEHGIAIWNPFGSIGANRVVGNLIGTDETGLVALGNGGSGIDISGSDHNQIGDLSQHGNLISGNQLHGIALRDGADENQILGNQIGTDATGTSLLPNLGDGIAIYNSNYNQIGDTVDGSGNRIAGNRGNGISIEEGTLSGPPSGQTAIGNLVVGNAIFDNFAAGIDLGDEGFTPNDTSGVADADSGANQLQNFPEIEQIELIGSTLRIRYRLPADSSAAEFPVRIEFFLADANGQEGRQFLGFDELTAAEAATSKTVDLVPLHPVQLSDQLVATATDGLGNTSEFSPPAQFNDTSAQLLVNVATAAVESRLRELLALDPTQVQPVYTDGTLVPVVHPSVTQVRIATEGSTTPGQTQVTIPSLDSEGPVPVVLVGDVDAVTQQANEFLNQTVLALLSEIDLQPGQLLAVIWIDPAKFSVSQGGSQVAFDPNAQQLTAATIPGATTRIQPPSPGQPGGVQGIVVAQADQGALTTTLGRTLANDGYRGGINYFSLKQTAAGQVAAAVLKVVFQAPPLAAGQGVDQDLLVLSIDPRSDRVFISQPGLTPQGLAQTGGSLAVRLSPLAGSLLNVLQRSLLRTAIAELAVSPVVVAGSDSNGAPDEDGTISGLTQNTLRDSQFTQPPPELQQEIDKVMAFLHQLFQTLQSMWQKLLESFRGAELQRAKEFYDLMLAFLTPTGQTAEHSDNQPSSTPSTTTAATTEPSVPRQANPAPEPQSDEEAKPQLNTEQAAAWWNDLDDPLWSTSVPRMPTSYLPRFLSGSGSLPSTTLGGGAHVELPPSATAVDAVLAVPGPMAGHRLSAASAEVAAPASAN